MRLQANETDEQCKDIAWQMFCDAHPVEACQHNPDGFWEYFRARAPDMTREQMVALLKECEEPMIPNPSMTTEPQVTERPPTGAARIISPAAAASPHDRRRIQARRTALGHTQQTLADVLGLARGTIARRETGALPITPEAALALSSLPKTKTRPHRPSNVADDARPGGSA